MKLIKVLFAEFGLFLFFGGINTLLLYTRHQIIYNNESIEQISWLGKKVTIHWDEIVKISYSPIASSLKVKTKDKKH
jgi:hypothetical protein